MSNLLKSIGQRYNNHMIKIGRQKARAVLLDQSDRTLQDLGISRTLLQQGNHQWPWQNEEEEQPAPARRRTVSRREEAKAIRTLRALSNRELSDIGISRGSIIDSVRNGRPGVERNPMPSQLLANMAHEAPTATIEQIETAASNSPDNTPTPTPTAPTPMEGSDKRVAA